MNKAMVRAILSLLVLLSACTDGKPGEWQAIYMVKELRGHFQDYLDDVRGLNYKFDEDLVYVASDNSDDNHQYLGSVLVLQFLAAERVEVEDESAALRDGITLCCYLNGSENEFLARYYGSNYLETLVNHIELLLSSRRQQLPCTSCEYRVSSIE